MTNPDVDRCPHRSFEGSRCVHDAGHQMLHLWASDVTLEQVTEIKSMKAGQIQALVDLGFPEARRILFDR
jgi:hypothetical protein